ncbi:hypothetical protein ACOMHN_001205 [Nucella lapillus]
MLPNDMIDIRRAVYRERRKKTPKLPVCMVVDCKHPLGFVLTGDVRGGNLTSHTSVQPGQDPRVARWESCRDLCGAQLETLLRPGLFSAVIGHCPLDLLRVIMSCRDTGGSVTERE